MKELTKKVNVITEICNLREQDIVNYFQWGGVASVLHKFLLIYWS